MGLTSILLVLATFLPGDLPHIDEAITAARVQRFSSYDTTAAWDAADRLTVSRISPSPNEPRIAPAASQGAPVEVWRSLVAEFFRPEDVDTALCVMWHESRGVPTAQNPTSTATGLMQIMHSVWRDTFGVVDRAEWHDPRLNVYAASVIRDTRGGWGHWVTYPKCR